MSSTIASPMAKHFEQATIKTVKKGKIFSRKTKPNYIGAGSVHSLVPQELNAGDTFSVDVILDDDTRVCSRNTNPAAFAAFNRKTNNPHHKPFESETSNNQIYFTNQKC